MVSIEAKKRSLIPNVKIFYNYSFLMYDMQKTDSLFLCLFRTCMRYMYIIV